MWSSPDAGLTIACEMNGASGPENPDATVGADLVTEDATVDDSAGVKVLGDSDYATGDTLHTLNDKGWTALVKP